MSEESTECVCGFEAKNSQGLKVHQRSCDEYEPDDGEDDAAAAEAEAQCDYSDFEEDVIERDDGECVNCDTDSELVVHKIKPDGSDERLSNFKTLCEGCDDELEGLHHRSKRTLIRKE